MKSYVHVHVCSILLALRACATHFSIVCRKEGRGWGDELKVTITLRTGDEANVIFAQQCYSSVFQGSMAQLLMATATLVYRTRSAL